MNLIESINRIKNVMGLINESVNTTELLNYAFEYIDANNCDKIYNDLIIYQNAVNIGEITINKEDKELLDSKLKQIKAAKKFFCSTIKKTMKDEFTNQSKDNPEKLVDSLCWFSKNIYKKTLQTCQSVKQPTINQAKPEIKIQKPVINQDDEIVPSNINKDDELIPGKVNKDVGI